MLFAVKKLVDAERAKIIEQEEANEALPVISLPETLNSWAVAKQGEIFVVTGRKIERFAERTDFDSRPGLERLRDIMNKMGIMHQLRRKGIEPGQKIQIGQANIGQLEY